MYFCVSRTTPSCISAFKTEKQNVYMKENTFSFIFFLQNLIVLLRLVPFSTFSTVNHLPACTFSGRTCFWLKLKMLHIEWRGENLFSKGYWLHRMILLFVPLLPITAAVCFTLCPVSLLFSHCALRPITKRFSCLSATPHLLWEWIFPPFVHSVFLFQPSLVPTLGS